MYDHYKASARLEILPKPTLQVSAFIKNEVKKVGITQEIGVYRYLHDDKYHFSASDRSIFIGQEAAINLEKLLNERKKLEKELLLPNMSYKCLEWERDLPTRINAIDDELYVYRAIIQHEAGHIAHQDIKKRFSLNVASPFILLGAFFGSEKMGINHWAGKIALGYGTLLGISLAKTTLKKHQESRADDFIQNDPKILKGAITNHKRYEKEISDFYLKKFPGTKYADLKKFPHSWIYASLFTSHPAPLKRVARFEKRLAKLEKQASIK